MPDPTRLLRTIDLAARAFHETPGRRGRVVWLQDVDEVLATGDLHGHIDNLKAILHRADLGKHPRRHLILQELIHGPFTYPAGGDKSHQLLDLLAALKCQYPRQVHMLLGNHELSQWTARAIAKADLDLNAAFREGVGTAYGPSAAAIYAAYQSLFAVVPLAVRTPNRVYLSHSLPGAVRLEAFDASALERDDLDEADLLPGGSVHSLVWGRDVSGSNAVAFLEKVDADLLITGHVPCDRGFDVPSARHLILDCLEGRACYCLFQTDRVITHEELIGWVTPLYS